MTYEQQLQVADIIKRITAQVRELSTPNTIDDCIDTIAKYTVEFMNTVNTEVFPDARLDLIDPKTLATKLIERIIENNKCHCKCCDHPYYLKVIDLVSIALAPSEDSDKLDVITYTDFLHIMDGAVYWANYTGCKFVNFYPFYNAMKILLYGSCDSLYVVRDPTLDMSLTQLTEARHYKVKHLLDDQIVNYKFDTYIDYLNDKLKGELTELQMTQYILKLREIKKMKDRFNELISE